MSATYALLCDLAACLCAELTPDGRNEPDLCFCGVIPGEIADAGMAGFGGSCESGECGMAWVRLEAAYPAETAGEVSVTANNCGTFLGLDIEIGVLRCVDCGEDGEPPTAAALEKAVAKQLADMEAMRSAVRCCDALADIDYRLGTYAPVGPQGCVAGGVWTVSVTL
jgi:hypothetical protein